jgi:hypothetical protein
VFYRLHPAEAQEQAMEVTTASKTSKKTPPSPERDGQGNGLNGFIAPGPTDLGLVLAGLQTMRDGDFSVRLPVAWTGLKGKIADTFNDIVSSNERMAAELSRVGQAVGREGRTRERARFQHAPGAKWKFQSIRWLRICCAQRRI